MDTPEPTPNAPAPSPATIWVEGARLDGGYVIGKQLGTGAFGAVHVVEHRALDRRWAAKIIRRDLVADGARRHLLLQELALGFQLAGHPHIVRTEMFRSFGNEIAIFSELVDGASLAAKLSDPQLSTPERILAVALQLAWALEAVHLAGLIHADVKPGNVLLTHDGTVKLTDLGLACLASARAGDARGTPRYRSPEQARRQALTTATDVWSWAVTMLALLLGEEPAHAGGELAAHTLTALRAHRPAHAALGELGSLLEACLQKAPVDRPSMTAIVNQLSVRVTRRTGLPAQRPPVTVAETTIARELSAHTESLRQMLDDHGNCPSALHDTVVRIGMAKAHCHMRAGDLAGVTTTLERVLCATSAAAAELRAAAWLDLGAAHHDRGSTEAAIYAFEQAASIIADPLARARAHRGAGVASWTAGDHEGAVGQLRTAAMLAAHAVDVSHNAEARHVHTEILLGLAGMLRELGDDGAYKTCLAHVLHACRTVGDAEPQILVRGFLMNGDFLRARSTVRDALPDDNDSAIALEAHAAAILIAATIDLEEARALAINPVKAISLARRSCVRLRSLAVRGLVNATLPLAVAEVHLAWLLLAAGEQPTDVPLDRTLMTLDDAASGGRKDAALLADWVRTMLLPRNKQ